MGSDYPRREIDAWRDHAACAGLDPDLFFPARGVKTAPIRAVCYQCPVQTACLVGALNQNESGENYSLGIRGGTTQRDRRRLRRLIAGGSFSVPSDRPGGRRGIRDPEDPRHGTAAGYRAHRRADHTACDACREADSEYRRQSRLGIRSPRPPILCGTPQGYARHIRNDEDACDECREAARLYQRERRAQRRQEVADAQAELGPRRSVAS